MASFARNAKIKWTKQENEAFLSAWRESDDNSVIQMRLLEVGICKTEDQIKCKKKNMKFDARGER